MKIPDRDWLVPPLEMEGLTRGMTHWPGCHEHHWNCAIRRLEALLSSHTVTLLRISDAAGIEWASHIDPEDDNEIVFAQAQLALEPVVRLRASYQAALRALVEIESLGTKAVVERVYQAHDEIEQARLGELPVAALYVEAEEDSDG